MLGFATSAVRDSVNSDEVLAHVEKHSGVALEVLSGEDEARLTFLAVRRWFGWSAGRLAVFDIGGGSLEIAGGTDEAPDVAWSLPLGAARMARTWFGGGRPSDDDVRELRKQVRAEIARDAGHLLRAGRARPGGRDLEDLPLPGAHLRCRAERRRPAGAARARARDALGLDPQADGHVRRRARRPARRLAESHPPDRRRVPSSPRPAWTSSTCPSSRSARGHCARA